MDKNKKTKESVMKKEKTDLKKQNKTPIFIIGSFAVVVIAAIVAVLLFTSNKKITISFDTDGAKEVSAIKISKGESIKLPDIEKEGFIFDGWYLNETRVTNSTKFTKDETLKAKWISEEAKIFKVTFDSNGGSKVESIVVECGKELSLPTNPSKNGYVFVSWVDKNEKPILNKALLSCEDITLKANWKKEESKKEETKSSNNTKNTSNSNNNTTTSKTKSYKCPSGYTLSGTKCISEINANEYCPSGYTWSNKVNKCVAKTTTIDGDCPSGYTWSSTQGVCVTFTDQIKTCVYGDSLGTLEADGYCYYGWNSNLTDKESCESAGRVWYNGSCRINKRSPETSCPAGYTYKVGGYYGWSIQKLSKCAKESQKIKTCPSGYKLYHSDPNFGLGDVCVKLSDKIKTCPSGYTLSGSKCRKTINATYE